MPDNLATLISEHLPASLQLRVFGLESWQILTFFALVLLALLFGLLFQRVLSTQLLRLAKRVGVTVTAELLAGTRVPMTWLAMGLIFRWGLADLQLRESLASPLRFASTCLMSVAGVVIASRVVDIGAHLFAQHAARSETRMDDQLVPLLNKALHVVLWLIGAVVVAENVGVDVGGLLTGLGIGGLAVALAAKDTLENLFGSLTIFSDRPFQLGDWIVVNSSTEGVVEEVGFRSTRIRTFYGSLVSVPNGKLATATIDNMGHRRFRRVRTTLDLTYDTPRESLSAFVRAIDDYLAGDAAVAQSTRLVRFEGFGPSSLQVMVYYFLDVPDWAAELRERERHFLEFLRLAEAGGVRFAFPSTSVYVEQLPRPDGA